MIKSFTFNITELPSQTSIEQYLQNKGCGRGIIAHLRRNNQDIHLNGINVPTTALLKAKDELVIDYQVETNNDILASDLPVDILYLDENILVVNKSSNMPVHPSRYHFKDSLANALAFRYPDCSYHCINRIDSDTSGAVLVGLNGLTAALLNHSQLLGQIDKEYVAFVEGKTPEHMIIDKPISRLAGKMKRLVSDDGERALSEFWTLRYNKEKNISMIKLHLQTGRTHQIRVHMSHIGHPVVGDRLYNPDNHQLSRQALHVSHLSFVHPFTGKLMQIEAPLPADLEDLC